MSSNNWQEAGRKRPLDTLYLDDEGGVNGMIYVRVVDIFHVSCMYIYTTNIIYQALLNGQLLLLKGWR